MKVAEKKASRLRKVEKISKNNGSIKDPMKFYSDGTPLSKADALLMKAWKHTYENRSQFIS